MKRTFSSVILIYALLLLALCGCQAQPKSTAFVSQITEEIPEVVTQEFEQDILNKYRPEGATDLPDFSGEITEVRITVVPREYVGKTIGIEEFDKLFENITSLQIYYGYLSDGEWHDIPCENYDLKGIFNMFHDYTGFEAAGDSHIVKIGPYLVICIQHSSDDAPKWATRCSVSDTLGSEVQQMFSEYYTKPSRKDGEHGYGYFKENRDSVIAGERVDFVATHVFDMYYYVILKYDEIPEDYKLSVSYWEGLTNTHRTLNYNEIVSLLKQ